MQVSFAWLQCMIYADMNIYFSHVSQEVVTIFQARSC